MTFGVDCVAGVVLMGVLAVAWDVGGVASLTADAGGWMGAGGVVVAVGVFGAVLLVAGAEA